MDNKIMYMYVILNTNKEKIDIEQMILSTLEKILPEKEDISYQKTLHMVGGTIKIPKNEVDKIAQQRQFDIYIETEEDITIFPNCCHFTDKKYLIENSTGYINFGGKEKILKAKGKNHAKKTKSNKD